MLIALEWLWISWVKEQIDNDGSDLKKFISNWFKSSLEDNPEQRWTSTSWLFAIATEYWKLKKKIWPALESESDEYRWLEFIMNKIEKILESQDIELLDYEGHKYDDTNAALDPIWKEIDESIPHTMVHKTMEPGILYRGKLKQKSKVIIATKEK